MKPRMGRPPLPKGEARDDVFTIRVNAVERHAIEAAAKRAGVLATVWARQVLVSLACSDAG